MSGLVTASVSMGPVLPALLPAQGNRVIAAVAMGQLTPAIEGQLEGILLLTLQRLQAEMSLESSRSILPDRLIHHQLRTNQIRRHRCAAQADRQSSSWASLRSPAWPSIRSAIALWSWGPQPRVSNEASSWWAPLAPIGSWPLPRAAAIWRSSPPGSGGSSKRVFNIGRDLEAVITSAPCPGGAGWQRPAAVDQPPAIHQLQDQEVLMALKGVWLAASAHLAG